MPYLGDGDPGLRGPLLSRLRDAFGFIPALFRAQAGVPAIVEAEIGLLNALVQSNTALSRIQKESVLLVTAVVQRNRYLFAAQYQTLQVLGVPERQVDAIVADYRSAGLKPATAALLEFAARLGQGTQPTRRAEIQRLTDAGLAEESILEAITVSACARFLCSLATGLGVAPDFTARELPSISEPEQQLESSAQPADRVFTPQLQAPHIVAAESKLFDAIFRSGGLTAPQKHSILFAAALASGNTCGVAVQDAALQSAGIAEGEIDRLASFLTAPHSDSQYPWENFCARLVTDPENFDGQQVHALKTKGFRDEEILEATVTASLGSYLNVLQFGLNIPAAFPLRPPLAKLLENKLNLGVTSPRPTVLKHESDPDKAEVDRIQNGDIDAFEILVERHGRRVYRTLIGLLGNPDEARDAMQDTFLKAFQHIGSFQRRSRFSTWLISIGTNTGLQRLRERRSFESIDEPAGESSDSFRPRQIRAWSDDPEKLFSKTETRALVEKGIMTLPASYRVVLMLRDIEQLPIEDVASGLGLTISAAKSRLLRGRLMLREALSPHFIPAEGAAPERGYTHDRLRGFHG